MAITIGFSRPILTADRVYRPVLSGPVAVSYGQNRGHIRNEQVSGSSRSSALPIWLR
jgi:hypothetical protein